MIEAIIYTVNKHWVIDMDICIIIPQAKIWYEFLTHYIYFYSWNLNKSLTISVAATHPGTNSHQRCFYFEH